MEIILKGEHKGDEAAASIKKVLTLFSERYQVYSFTEIHFSVTLMDEEGEVVELIDSESNQVYRVFEVFRDGHELNGRKGVPLLQLVVDNTGRNRP